MKKFISILALLFTMTVTVNAMSYEQARQQALFLTDKMAYELNLTNDQYEAAYEMPDVHSARCPCIDNVHICLETNKRYGRPWSPHGL